MLPSLAIRRRLVSLGQIARDFLEDEAVPEPVPEPTPSALDQPLEHLRHAIASARKSDATAPAPKVYRELRLLLNQLESGRISTETTRELTTVPQPLPTPPPRGFTGLLCRKAQHAVRRVIRRF